LLKSGFVPPSTFLNRSGDNGQESALSICTNLTADPGEGCLATQRCCFLTTTTIS